MAHQSKGIVVCVYVYVCACEKAFLSFAPAISHNGLSVGKYIGCQNGPKRRRAKGKKQKAHQRLAA